MDYKFVMVDGVPRCDDGCPHHSIATYCCVDVDYCNATGRKIDADSLCEPAILARLAAAEALIAELMEWGPKPSEDAIAKMATEDCIFCDNDRCDDDYCNNGCAINHMVELLLAWRKAKGE